MNYDILLGIDWLRQHNPLIDWESNQVSLSCCGANSIVPGSGDAQPSPPIIPLQKGDDPVSLDNPRLTRQNVSVGVISTEDLLNSDNISILGLINLKTDSATLGATSIPEEPTPDPKTLSYIQSRVPKEYHGFVNVFFNREATTLPPHRDQDIKIELEEGRTPPFGPIYSLTTIEKEAL